MRLVNTFMIPMSGGRVTIALSTIALMIPCIWASEILKSKDASFVQLVICAALTGVRARCSTQGCKHTIFLS